VITTEGTEGTETTKTDLKIAALLAIAVLLVFSDVLFLGTGFYVRDVIRDYLPSRFVLREIVFSGVFPAWNRFYSAGQPLAANPGFQAFYPGTWLCFLPNFLFGFNLEILLHIALAAAGMYLLLRSMKLRITSALFGAIAFSLGGAVLSLTNLLPFLTSVAWWPWILMFAIRRKFGAMAIALGMLLLAGEVSVIVQTAILLMCVWSGLSRTDRLKPVLTLFLALGIGAITILPALDLGRDTQRARGISFEDGTSWSMPLVRPAELFYSHAFGRITDDGAQFNGRFRYRPPRLPLILSIYCGLLVPLLAIAGVAMRLQKWTWIAIPLSYLLATGALPIFYRWIRYPEKFVLFGLFALIVLAASAFDRIDVRFAPFLLFLTAGDLAMHINELAPRMSRNFFTPPRVTLAVAGPNRIFNEAEWPVWGAHGPYLEGGERTYWSQRTALFPFEPSLWGLRTIYEIDINLTTLKPTADMVQSMWESLRAGAPLRPFMMMGNVEYLLLPGRPIRIVHGPTLPEFWYADQVVQIRSREEFVRALTSQRWSDRTAFVFSPVNGRLLVYSATPHRYWRATIDGKPAPIITANIGLQAVVVPNGAHWVNFEYFNPLFIVAGAITIISLLISIIVMIYHDD
jgi:hypothetical protein